MKNNQVNIISENVIKNFLEISKIPRITFHCEKISKFLSEYFKKCGAKVETDKSLNVYAWLPATKGYEKKPMITLQGHMDMVGTKAKSSNHDFLKDPIKTTIKNGWMSANNTTLGADDGIAIAIIMEIFSNKNIAHGPIEALITVDEEQGLVGACALPDNTLKGKYLINIDGNNDTQLVIGSLGMLSYRQTIKISNEKPKLLNKSIIEINLNDCSGGHSGNQSADKKINAIKMISIISLDICNQCNGIMANVNGGTLFNVIAQNAKIVLVIDTKKLTLAQQIVKNYQQNLKKEYEYSEPKMSLSCKKLSKLESAIDSINSKKILNYLASVVNSVQYFDKQAQIAMVSANLAKVTVNKNEVEVLFSIRGPSHFSMNLVFEQYKAACATLDYKMTLESEAKFWTPDFKHNKLAQQYFDLYLKKFKVEPTLYTIAGGLESAIIMSKNKNMQGITVGPNDLDLHSETERLEIKSVTKMVDMIIDLLINIK